MFVALQLAAVLVLALAGGGLGWALTRHAGRLWVIGYVVPMAALLLVILGRRVIPLSFHQPFAFVTRTDVTYLLMAFAVPLLLTTLLPRLRTRGQQVAVGVLTAFMLTYYAILPVIMPPIAATWLAEVDSQFDKQGVCRQTHTYTCGPAAAVNVLRRWGIAADEGELGIAAGTAPVVGTDGRDLAAAINRLHGGDGVEARYVYLGSVEALRQQVPALVSIAGTVNKHMVAVVEMDEEEVMLADPEAGRRVVSVADFARVWDGAAVVFEGVGTEKGGGVKRKGRRGWGGVPSL